MREKNPEYVHIYGHVLCYQTREWDSGLFLSIGERFVISCKSINVMKKKKNIDVRRECVFRSNSFLMEISIGQDCPSTSVNREWDDHLCQFNQCDVAMSDGLMIDCCSRDCQSTTHVRMRVISISCVKLICSPITGRCGEQLFVSPRFPACRRIGSRVSFVNDSLSSPSSGHPVHFLSLPLDTKLDKQVAKFR